MVAKLYTNSLIFSYPCRQPKLTVKTKLWPNSWTEWIFMFFLCSVLMDIFGHGDRYCSVVSCLHLGNILFTDFHAHWVLCIKFKVWLINSSSEKYIFKNSVSTKESMISWLHRSSWNNMKFLLLEASNAEKWNKAVNIKEMYIIQYGKSISS